MSIVTVSRQEASLGDEIASRVAERLGCSIVTRESVIREWFPEVASEHELHMLRQSPGFYKRPSQNGTTFADFVEERLRELCSTQSLVIKGLGSQLMFRRDPDATHVRVVASRGNRLRHAARAYGLGEREAEQLLRVSDRKHRRYVWEIFGEDWKDPSLYHLCVNTDGISVEHAAELIIHLVDLGKASPSPLGRPAEVRGEEAPAEGDGSFAHPSEEEFAKILDLHQVRWEYEPTTFPIEWDAEGNVTSAFTPDFWLPEFDTYIELTTMRQKLVTEKHKKVRRLQELYPRVNIRLVHRKDYHTLLERYGFTKEEHEE